MLQFNTLFSIRYFLLDISPLNSLKTFYTAIKTIGRVKKKERSKILRINNPKTVRIKNV